jgi:tRNA pseudouridine38-40 synthase
VAELDPALLEGEALAARGTHDFAGFRSAGDARPTTVRTLTRVEVLRDESPRVLSIVVEGDAFLYNMVRILVGTMVDVARGRLEEGAVARALASRDRRTAGTTAPAHGLVLERVDIDLPSEAGDPWPQ